MTQKTPHNQTAVIEWVRFMRKNRIKRLSIHGLQLELEPRKAKPKYFQGDLQADRLPELTEEQKQKEADEILYYSSG